MLPSLQQSFFLPCLFVIGTHLCFCYPASYAYTDMHLHEREEPAYEQHVIDERKPVREDGRFPLTNVLIKE